MWILNLVTVCTKIAKYILKKKQDLPNNMGGFKI